MCDFASSIDDVEGIELLRWEDQQQVRKYVEGSGSPASNTVTTTECSIEVSKSSRATCKQCSQKIMKGEVSFNVLQSFYETANHCSSIYTEIRGDSVEEHELDIKGPLLETGNVRLCKEESLVKNYYWTCPLIQYSLCSKRLK